MSNAGELMLKPLVVYAKHLPGNFSYPCLLCLKFLCYSLRLR